MKNLIKVENIIKDLKLDLVAIEKNLMTPRRIGTRLKDEVVLVNDFPYKVTTNEKAEIIHITGITESDQVDLKTNLSLMVKFGIEKSEIDCTEIPKLININEVGGMKFREFIAVYKAIGF